MADKTISIADAFCEIGGHRVTGFDETGVKLPSSEAKVSSKKGLDSVAWLRADDNSIEREASVFILADSPSVKVLKTFEKTGVIVPFRFEWEELGVYFESLEARVEEVSDFELKTEMPVLEFKITCRKVVEMKGL